MKQNKKLIVILCCVLAVLIAAFALIWFFTRPQGQEGAKNITVEVVLADGAKKEHKINTDAEFLRGALEEKNLIAGDESQYGLYVKTVDGVTVDDSKQEWWCFTKGGEMLMTGVDDTPIADGDHFEITLTVGW